MTTTPNEDSLVDRLVTRRKSLKIRQQDVAEFLGVGQPAVSDLESGVTSPKWTTLENYAAALGVKLEVSFKEVSEDGSPVERLGS